MEDILFSYYRTGKENEIISLQKTVEELKSQLEKSELKITELNNLLLLNQPHDINKHLINSVVDKPPTSTIVVTTKVITKEVTERKTQPPAPNLTQKFDSKKVVRERIMVRRLPLFEVLSGKTRKFKIAIEKKEFFMDGNGKEFTDGKTSFRSLNAFVVLSILQATGDDKRSISAYDEKRGIQIQHHDGSWEFLGACYKETTDIID